MRNFLLIPGALFAAVAPDAAHAANAGRTEIERIVVRGAPGDQEALKAWLTKHAAEPDVIEAELLGSGFEKEPMRDNCFAYSYVGKEAGTRDDRTASVTYCNGKLVWVSIITWFPFDKNPKGPLPLIKPATGSGK